MGENNKDGLKRGFLELEAGKSGREVEAELWKYWEIFKETNFRSDET
jgi:hypothetical protein